MNFKIRVPITTTPEQVARLAALQAAFAEVCNALAPIVQQTHCWNRVGLHHLAYRSLRERFPQIGSQMVCNAIYSVSRTCRVVLQHPNSPFNIAKHPERPLPLLKFLPSAPVYFDRHTLSLKAGQLSMYTLDGRMRFQVELKPDDQLRFHQEKLHEIILSGGAQGFQLTFAFSSGNGAPEMSAPEPEAAAEFPEYLLVEPDAESATLDAPKLKKVG